MAKKTSTKPQIKTIGILTSGGDAPGMNAGVRAVVRAALAKGLKVYFIKEGYKGLVDYEKDHSLVEECTSPRKVGNIINKSGTILYTARCDEFAKEEGMNKALQTIKELQIDGIVALGGDGTFRGATDLAQKGIRTIGVPCTIDNDITATDVTIGFDTAMNTAMNLIDNLRDTCESHARCNVIEAMGRDAGHIALRVGIASGATAIAIPEFDFDEDAVIEKIKQQKADGKRSFIVVVSEGYRDERFASPSKEALKKEKADMPLHRRISYAEFLAEKIQAETKIETKFARPAHTQRGGEPTLQDRLLASEMGSAAIKYLMNGKTDIIVRKVDGQISYLDIKKALTVDCMLKTALIPDFKRKLTEKDIEALDPKDKTWMEKRCKKVMDDIKNLYDIANEIC